MEWGVRGGGARACSEASLKVFFFTMPAFLPPYPQLPPPPSPDVLRAERTAAVLIVSRPGLEPAVRRRRPVSTVSTRCVRAAGGQEAVKGGLGAAKLEGSARG